MGGCVRSRPVSSGSERPTRSTKPAGWYRDPSGKYDWRYFDGQWTDAVQNEGDDATYSDPVPRRPVAQEDSPAPTSDGSGGKKRIASWPLWRHKVWKLPVWVWAALVIAGLIASALSRGRDATDEAQDSPGAPAEQLTVGSPAQPRVSSTALDFLDAEECHVHHLRDDGTVRWFECTRTNPAGEGTSAVAYITEDSDPVAALADAQRFLGYRAEVSTLFTIRGGGIVYFPDQFAWGEMFNVAPWPDLDVVDTDCAPFPEANPDLCPTNVPAAGDSTSTGLTESTAWLACVQQGDAVFRYGWDPHSVMGWITREIVDDRWFFKLEADVTNQFGAEASGVVECLVSGSEAHPVVEALTFG